MDVLKFFIAHEEVILIGFFFLLFMFGIFAGVIFFILRKNGVKSISKKGLIFNAETTEKNVSALMLQNRKLKDTVQGVDTIEYRETLTEQMSIVDKEVDRCVIRAREIHLDLLIKYLGDEEARKHDANERYAMITEIMRASLTDKLRLSMRENHFYEKTELEFQMYIKGKVEELFKIVSNLIDHGYKHDVVGVVELRDLQASHINEYHEMMSNIFINAREISRKNRTRVEILWRMYRKIESHYIKTGEILPEESEETK